MTLWYNIVADHMPFENLLKPRITYRCICIIIIWATNYSKVKQSWNIDRRLFSTRITFISFQGLFEEFIQLIKLNIFLFLITLYAITRTLTDFRWLRVWTSILFLVARSQKWVYILFRAPETHFWNQLSSTSYSSWVTELQ